MRNENTLCENIPHENTPCENIPHEGTPLESVPHENIPHEIIPPSSNKKTGAFGERLAAHHLETLGFILIARNLKVGRLGEIDLVARAEDGRTLCFVEVKTRTSELYGTPAESVTFRKRARIRKMAQAWLSVQSTPGGPGCGSSDIPVRFDVVEVMLDRMNHSARVHHIPNAF